MTVFLTRRRFLACGSFYVLLLCFVFMTSAPAVAQDDDAVITAIVNHPGVALARSNICRARSSYDLAVSEQRPKVDFSVRGGASLKSNFESDETYRRRFNNDGDNVDAIVGLNQLLIDWNGVDASKKSALSDQAGSRVALLLETDRIAADILDLGLKISEQQERLDLYEGHKRELTAQVEGIEARVEAGVLRVSDLRRVRLVELDTDIAISFARRQLDLLDSELNQRFGLARGPVLAFVETFRQNRPGNPPVIDSAISREVQRIDHQIAGAGHQINRLKSERRPRLNSIFNTTFFDIDSYSQEYELSGELRVTMPLYDGGSNQARRDEEDWRRRGLTNERENTIRQHRNVVETNQRNIDRARENISSNKEKITAVRERLEEERAREGQTAGDSLSVVNVNEELISLHSEQIALLHQVELGLLQGVFFADTLGELLGLPSGSPQC